MDEDDDRLEDPANVVSPYPSYYEGPRMDFNPHTSNSPGSADLKNTLRGRHDINCTLWVGNLDQRVSEAIIQELFLQIGPIQSVIFPKRKEDCGRNRGFCFVNFFHPNSVPRAMRSMGETVLFGRKLNLRSRPHSIHSVQNHMPGSDRFVQVVDRPSGNNPASSGPHKRPFGCHEPAGPFHGMGDHDSQYSRTVCIAPPEIHPEESPQRKVLVVHSSLCSEPDVKIKISNYSKPKISSVLVTPPPSTVVRSEMNTKQSDTTEDKGRHHECSKFDSSDAKRSPKRSDLSDNSWKSAEYSGRSREATLEPTKTHRNVSFPSSNESSSNEPAMRMNENKEHMRFNQPYGNNWQDYWQSRETEGPLVSNQWGFGHQVSHQPARPHGRYIWVNANFHQQQYQHQNYQRVHPYYSQQRFCNNDQPFRQSYDNQSDMYSRTDNGQFSWVNNNNNPSYWKGSNAHSLDGPRHQREYCNQNPSHNFESYQGHQSEHRELINLSPPKEQPTNEIPESTTTSLTSSSSRHQNDQADPTNSITDASHKPSRHRSSSSDSDVSRKHSRSRRRHHHRRYSSSSSSSYSSSSSNSNDDKQVSSSSHVRSSKFSSSGKKNNSSSKSSSSPGLPSEYDPHHPQL